MSCLFMGTSDDTFEAKRQGRFRRFRSVDSFPVAERVIQYIFEAFRVFILFGVQIQMQHRPFHPVFFQLFYRQPFEQFALAFEVGFEGGDQQAFAETARAAEEVVTATIYQLIH